MKTCPFIAMGLAANRNDYVGGYSFCLKEGCAWWDKDRCAITSISHAFKDSVVIGSPRKGDRSPVHMWATQVPKDEEEL